MHDLFQLEKFSRDAFRVKKTYIDICGDLVAGILLGQIIFWFMPNEFGKSKLGVVKNGKRWLAKGRDEWHDEIRITPKQFDRAIRILVEKEFVETWNTMFDGKRTVHIHLNQERVFESVTPVLTFGEHRNLPLGNTDFDQKETPITEITTEITTEINNKEAAPGEGKTERPRNLFDAYFMAFGRHPSPIQIEKLGAFIDQDGMDQELVIACIEKAAIAGANLNYALKVLSSLANEGIKTVAEWHAAEERRFNNGANRRGAEKTTGTRKPERPRVDHVDVDLSEYE